jgi:hypothetical protein
MQASFLLLALRKPCFTASMATTIRFTLTPRSERRWDSRALSYMAFARGI